MNSRTTHAGLRATPWMSFCAAIALVSTASAQTQRYYPPSQGGYPQQPQYSQPPPNYQQPPPGYGGYPQQQSRYENPIEFLPKFGKRMGEMFRRVFYGERASGWNSPPPAYGSNGGYSLDSNSRQHSAPNYPQQPGYHYPAQQPAYQTPPRTSQPTTPGKSTAPATDKKSKTSTRTYSPPKVSSPPPSKSRSKPPASVQPETPAPEPPPPPTTTTRRSETTPKEFPTTASSSNSDSFLKGRKTAKAGRVISPYPPYKELDVTGLDSGSLALDPTTQKVFEVP